MKAITISSFLAAMCLISGGKAQPTLPPVASQASQQETATPAQDPQLFCGKLPNGLSYFIRPNAEPKGCLSIRLRVNTGSLNETDDIQGVSHFLEHMVFNGSKHFKRGEIVEVMQKEGLKLGGDVNAYTSFDETVYIMDLPSLKDSLVDFAFTVMRDFADGALLEKDSIDKERGIITSEYKVRDSANFRMLRDIYGVLLDGTMVSKRFPIGKLEVIRDAPQEKFLAYYQSHYVPSQMQLVIVGDVNPEQAKKWVETYFGSMKKDQYEFQKNWGAIKLNDKPTSHWIMNKESASTGITVNVVKPFTAKADTVANRIAQLPLSLAYDMLNRRLAKMANKPDCPFLNAGGSQDDDLFNLAEIDSVQIQTVYEHWQDSLKSVIQEMRRAVDFGFTPEEWEESTRNLLASLDNNIKTWPTQKSENLATDIVDTVSKDRVFSSPEEELRIIKNALLQLTPESCHAALKEVWADSQPRIIVSTNHENNQGPAEIMEAYQEAQDTTLTPYRPEAIKPFSYHFGVPGKVTQLTEDKDLDVTQLTLSNGIRVNLKPTTFDRDFIQITFAINGGKITRPEQKAGLENFAEIVMNTGGIASHSVDDLSSALSGKIVGTSFVISDSDFLIRGACSAQDLETQLQLQVAELMSPGYREEGAQKFKKELPQIFRKIQHDVEAAMKKIIPDVLYKGNPRFTFPTQDQLASYQIADVKEWLDAPLKNAYMEVTVTGDFSPKDIIPVLEKTIGSLPARQAEPVKPNEDLRHPEMIDFNTTKDVLVDSAIDKTMVNLFWKTPGGDDKKMNRRISLLRSLFGDRVFKGIREGMGETYSPATKLYLSETYPDNAYISVTSSGVMRNKDMVSDAIMAIAAKLGTGDITAEELDRARNPLLSSMERSRLSNGYWADMLMDSQSRPQRLAEIKEAIDDVKSITPEEINKLAQEIFGQGKVLNLNILPDHPDTDTPPAEKQEVAPTGSEKAAATTAAFSVHTTVVNQKSSNPFTNAVGQYAILISEQCAANPQWKAVADKLAAKYKTEVLTFKDSVFSKLDDLKKQQPRYLALVSPPEEIDREVINELHRLTRQLDSDPYGDCIWGVITGYTPADAMRIVTTNRPLLIKKAMGTTNIDSSRFTESMCITDWQPFQFIEQRGGKKDVQPAFYTEGLKLQEVGDAKTLGITPKLVEYWKNFSPQLFVTASHATQFNLEMPFSKGIIVSGNNQFYALNQNQFKEFTTFLSGVLFNGKEDDLMSFLKRSNPQTIKIKPQPAVWLAAGNCLLGDVKKSKNTMAVTALSRYGFNQFIGYTVPSWYGKGGWGTLSLFFSNHDTSSLAEAWYLNNQFILDETMTRFPKLINVHFNSADINSMRNDPSFAKGMQEAGYGMGKDQIGLVHDRDTVSFYGDPAWVARLDESQSTSPWHITWNDCSDTANGFTIIANRDAQGRFAIWFPKRINAKEAIISVGGKKTPVKDVGLLTNDFLLLRNLELKKGEKATIELN